MSILDDLKNTKYWPSIVNIKSEIENLFSEHSDRDMTKHNVTHVESILKYYESFLDDWIEHETKSKKTKELFPTKLYILIAATYLHDIGMQIVNIDTLRKFNSISAIISNENLEFDDSNEEGKHQITKFARKHHHEITFDWISNKYENCSRLPDFKLEKDCRTKIAEVARAHNVWLTDDSSYRKFEDRLRLIKTSEGYIDVVQLACFLRLGDILDQDKKRAEIWRLSINKIDPESELHWWRHNLVQACRLNRKDGTVFELEVVFRIPSNCENDKEWLNKFLYNSVVLEIYYEFERIRLKNYISNVISAIIIPSIDDCLNGCEQLEDTMDPDIKNRLRLKLYIDEFDKHGKISISIGNYSIINEVANKFHKIHNGNKKPIFELQVGTYGGFVIEHPMILMGKNQNEVKIHENSDFALTIQADNVEVKNMTIHGINIHKVTSVTINDCLVTNSPSQLPLISITDTDKVDIKSCCIRGNQSSGIFVSDKSRCYIHDSDIYNIAGYGIELTESSYCYIKNCKIYNCLTTAIKSTGSDIDMDSCYIYSSSRGYPLIDISGDKVTVLFNIKLSQIHGSTSIGLMLYDGVNAHMNSNEIYECSNFGILAKGENVRIDMKNNCKITKNATGILLMPECVMNINDCNFTENGIDIESYKSSEPTMCNTSIDSSGLTNFYITRLLDDVKVFRCILEAANQVTEYIKSKLANEIITEMGKHINEQGNADHNTVSIVINCLNLILSDNNIYVKLCNLLNINNDNNISELHDLVRVNRSLLIQLFQDSIV